MQIGRGRPDAVERSGFVGKFVGSGDFLVERGVGGFPRLLLAPKSILEFSALKDVDKPSVGGCPFWMELSSCLLAAFNCSGKHGPIRGREDCPDDDLCRQLKARTSGGKRRRQQERHFHALEDFAIRFQVFRVGSHHRIGANLRLRRHRDIDRTERLVARRDRVAADAIVLIELGACGDFLGIGRWKSFLGHAGERNAASFCSISI